MLGEPRVRPRDLLGIGPKRAPEALAVARESELPDRRLELARHVRDDEARAGDPGLQTSYVSRTGKPRRARQRVSASWSCAGSPMSSHSPAET